MKFLLNDEQAEFGHTLDRMLGSAGAPAAARAWGEGEHGPGLDIWEKLAKTGVFALAVSEEHGGMGPLAAELAVAFVELGRHAVPGPLVETTATAVLLEGTAAGADGQAVGEWLHSLAAGETPVSLVLPGGGPYALDADAARAVFRVPPHGEPQQDADSADLVMVEGHGPVQSSFDPARRLARPLGDGTVLASGPAVLEAAQRAERWAAFLTAAQSLGVGLALLEQTVAYVKQRTQFSSVIGAFQTVKHQLATILKELEFARPLLHGAAVALDSGAPTADAEVAAAKAASGEAAYAASRTALQLHGAIGYTREMDLALWIGKARALRSAWGTPAACRARALEGLPAAL